MRTACTQIVRATAPKKGGTLRFQKSKSTTGTPRSRHITRMQGAYFLRRNLGATVLIPHLIAIDQTPLSPKRHTSGEQQKKKSPRVRQTFYQASCQAFCQAFTKRSPSVRQAFVKASPRFRSVSQAFKNLYRTLGSRRRR